MDFTEQIRVRAFQRQKQYPRIFGSDRSTVTKDNAEEEIKAERPKRMDHCKSRLAMLASEINQWEDDLQHLSSHQKSTESSKENKAGNVGIRRAHVEKPVTSNEIFKVPETKSQKSVNRLKHRRSSNIKNKTSSRRMSITKGNQLLDNSVVHALEAQGFCRSESGGRLLYDYKNACVRDENAAPNSNNKPIRSNIHLDAGNLKKKENGNVIQKPVQSSTKRFDNRDRKVRDSFKVSISRNQSENFKDPALLSVAERRRLFESKMNNSHVTNMKSKLQQAAVTRRKVMNNCKKDTVSNIVVANKASCNGLPKNAESAILDDRCTDPCKSYNKAVSHIVTPAEVSRNDVPKTLEKVVSNENCTNACVFINKQSVSNVVEPKNVSRNDTSRNLHTLPSNDSYTDEEEEFQKKETVLISSKTASDNLPKILEPVVSNDKYFDSNKFDKKDVVLNNVTENMIPTNGLLKSPDPAFSNDGHTNSGKVDKSSAVLKTLKQVKFSTPKPGHLYPCLDDTNFCNDEKDNIDDIDQIDGRNTSDIDDDNLESLSITSNSDNLFSGSLDHENSFGREIFSATKDIFSSYSNSKDGDISKVQHSETIDSVSQLNKFLLDLNNPSCPVSCSPSPAKRSRDGSFVTGEEVSDMSASFTYMQKSNEDSTDFSHNLIKIEDGCESSIQDTVDTVDEQTKVDRKISLLEDVIQKERSIAIQTIQALNLCTSNPKYLYSTAHLEAEKLLLLSNHRGTAAQVEIDRLSVEKVIHALNSANGEPITKGRLIISDIKIPIKMNVINEDAKEFMYNYLLCLIKCEETVYASSVIPVTNENISQSLNPNYMYVLFQEKFIFPEIYSDFKIVIEVYNLFIENKVACNLKHANVNKKGHIFKFSAKKGKDGQSSPSINQQRAPDSRVTNSSFFKVGNMIFSINETHRSQFILTQKHVYHNPLVGIIQMKINCHPIITAQYHGFLTMYEVISGFGAWTRYWFYHFGDRLSYWKYPDEEQTRPPIDTLNLRNCITRIVDTVGIEVCARPHTFSLTFITDGGNNLEKSTVTEGNTRRYLLSADNTERRIEWCSSLNNVLRALHTWLNVPQQKSDTEEVLDRKL